MATTAVKNGTTETTQATKTVSTPHTLVNESVRKELENEINIMLSFALNNGLIINSQVNTLLESSNIDNLIQTHNLLSKNVAPATPKSIAYLNTLNQNASKGTVLNKLPLVRNLIYLSLFFLVAFVATALSPHVNNDSLDKGIMNNEGIPLLLNIIFLCSVSGLGVLFYLLKNVSKSIENGTLIPEDSIYYTALIILGIIAGLILSEIISLYSGNPDGINLFNRSILALIGGFSSDAIFSILQSLIGKIKKLFPVEAS